MPDFDDSLGDDPTYVGKGKKRDDQSLGDQSTYAGGNESSLGGLGGIGGDLEDGLNSLEIIDLESRYTIIRPLGKGGMGEVVLATDTRLNRKVAIKRMLGHAAKSKAAVRRFLTEAQSIAALNHFNIVQIHDYGRDKDGPFLIMEYVGNGSLLDKSREGALPLEEAVELTCQLCDGLKMAHDAGIIHRDIKPANILLTADGLPKLTDFGLARQDTGETGQTMAGTVLGTLDFMSPEQRRDATQTDNRSDQWSLAATFYQMVTGELPRVIDGGAIPEAVRETTLRALKTNPADRFDSMSEFGDSLRSALSSITSNETDPLALAEGQCAACGASNDTGRKFCKGCGESLQFPCPHCTEPAAIWEHFCGHCGGDIRSCLESQLIEARELRDTLPSLRSTYQHAEALSRLQPLVDASHPALDEYRNWGVEAHKKLSSEYATLQEQRDQLETAAREQLDQGKFSAAHKYIGQIPESLHTENIQSLADEITAKSDEVKQIGAVIQSAIKTRSYDGLLSQVEHYLTLKPGDATGQKLRDRLLLRERKKRNREAALATEEELPEHDFELSTTRSVTSRRQKGQRKPAANHLRLLVGGGVLLVLVVIGILLSGSDEPSALTTVSNSAENDASIVSVESSATDDDSIASNDSNATGDSDASLQSDSIRESTASTVQDPSAKSTGGWFGPKSTGGWFGPKSSAEIPNSKGGGGDRSTKETNNEDLQPVRKPAPARAVAFGNSHYLFIHREMDWESAKRHCELLGGHLPIVTSQKENDFLRDMLMRETVKSNYKAAIWLGASDASQEGSWKWIDGSPVNFNAWGPQQPNNKQQLEHYAILWRGGLNPNAAGDWSDQPMKSIQHSVYCVCEWDEPSAIVPSDATQFKHEIDAGTLNTLTLSERQSGWELLFDGKSTRGWRNYQTNTISSGWKAIEGALTRIEEGAGTIVTADQYDSFELALEYKVAKGAKSGLLYHVVESEAAAWQSGPEVQILDNINNSDRFKAGWLYQLYSADVDMTRPAGEWNELRIRITPELCEHSVNGVKYFSYVKGDNEWSNRVASSKFFKHRGFGKAKRGHIALQDQGGEVSFRNIKIRKITLPDLEKTNDTLMQLGRNIPASAVAPFDTSQAKTHQKAWAEHLGVSVESTNSIGMKFVVIPPGEFMMGSQDDEPDREDTETLHKVTLTQPLLMGMYEVTQEQYQRVMGINPSAFQFLQNPVDSVAWGEAVEFCRKMSSLPAEKSAGYVYRLPTEAEWEHACRAGTDTAYSFGDSDVQLDAFAWYVNNSRNTTHLVGQKKSNPWGLYDIHGNVWEWCQDWLGDYPSGSVTDPTGPLSGSRRLTRGGTYGWGSDKCRSADRSARKPDGRHTVMGFRVVRVAKRTGTAPGPPASDELTLTDEVKVVTPPTSARDLLNGKDLSGWSARKTDSAGTHSSGRWSVDERRQAITSTGEVFDYLVSDESFDEYIFELEWRFKPGGPSTPNGSGVVIHSTGNPFEGNPKGYEIDLRKPPTSGGKPVASGRIRAGTGAVICYGVTAANHTGPAEGTFGSVRGLGLLRSPKINESGGWNRLRIATFDDQLLVWINDELVNEVWNLSKTFGRICLRSQKSAVEFRRVSIRSAPEGDKRVLLQLDGKWRAVRQRVGGNQWTYQKLFEHKKSIQFSDDRFTINYLSQTSGKPVVEYGRSSITGNNIDLLLSGGNTGQGFLGVYELENGILRHCLVKSDTGKGRPQSVDTQAGMPQFGTTYIRWRSDEKNLQIHPNRFFGRWTQTPTYGNNAGKPHRVYDLLPNGSMMHTNLVTSDQVVGRWCYEDNAVWLDLDQGSKRYDIQSNAADVIQVRAEGLRPYRWDRQDDYCP